MRVNMIKIAFKWNSCSIPQEGFKQEHTIMAQKKQIIPTFIPTPKPRMTIKNLLTETKLCIAS